MDLDGTKRQKMDSDFEVTGVSRSGRVRKKSSKLMDFESPDNIDSRPSKIPASRAPVTAPKGYVNDRDSPASKSENEDALGAGSSDSDFYDPAMDQQDSMDSVDSEDALSEAENGLNSSGERGEPSRIVLKPSDYVIEKSPKKKTPSRSGAVMKSAAFNQSIYNTPLSHSKAMPRNGQQQNFRISSSTVSNSQNSSVVSSNPNKAMYRVVGVGPMEIGAHLRLLGESLVLIGDRLKDHKGPIAVSGSVSVLLDTLLCSLAPLICLTAQIPEIAPPQKLLQDTLDNIAYIMPGL